MECVCGECVEGGGDVRVCVCVCVCVCVGGLPAASLSKSSLALVVN